VRKDGSQVKAPLLITDAKMIAKIDAGHPAQLSCGYFADLEPSIGEWHGQRYDAIQRNIRGNHVAIVDTARAGPEAKIRLDSFSGIMLPSNNREQTSSQGITEMNKKIRIDGVDFEVAEPVAQAYANKKDALKKEIAKAEKKADKAEARADAAEAELVKAKEALKVATDPVGMREQIKARVSLETQARSVVGPDIKLDSLSERDVKIAVISKLTPDFKASGKSDDYVSARYDLAIETVAKSEDPLSLVRKDRIEEGNDDGTQHLDADKAKAKFMAESRSAWKKPLTAVAPGFKA
jgi:hypothetical protein